MSPALAMILGAIGGTLAGNAVWIAFVVRRELRRAAALSDSKEEVNG